MTARQTERDRKGRETRGARDAKRDPTHGQDLNRISPGDAALTGVTGAAGAVAPINAAGQGDSGFATPITTLRAIIADPDAKDSDRIAASRALAQIENASRAKSGGAGGMSRAELTREIERIRAMLHG